MSVRTITTIEEIETIRKTWADWCEDLDADPEFFMLSSELDRVVRPHVIVVYRGGSPDCILIGRLEEGFDNMRIGYASVFRPYVRTLIFPAGAYLGNQSPENSELLVSEICKSLKTGEADCAELRQVPFGSSLSDKARTQPSLFSRQRIRVQRVHRRLDLPPSFEEYFRALPRKLRHEARRHARLLQKDFPNSTHIQCYTDERQVKQLTRDVKRVHVTSYQATFGVGFADTDGTRARFLTAAKRGGLRGCVMYISGEPVAYFVAIKFKQKLFGQYLGFNPKFSRYSVGLQILYHAIEESCNPSAQLSAIDLGWGERNFKRALCNRSWTEGPIHIFSPTWKGLRLKFEQSITISVDTLAKRGLKRFRLDEYFKKIWQNFAVHKAVR